MKLSYKNKFLRVCGGLALLVGLYEAVSRAFDLFAITFPSSLVAMVILYFLLLFKIIPLWVVEDACKLILKFMPLYFVPILVGIMTYKELLAGKICSILSALVLSAAITMLATAFCVEFLQKRKCGAKEKEDNQSERIL